MICHRFVQSDHNVTKKFDIRFDEIFVFILLQAQSIYLLSAER
jgi:hypothetical protein